MSLSSFTTKPNRVVGILPTSFVVNSSPTSRLLENVSPDFKPSARDSKIIRQTVKYDKTPEAIRYFAKNSKPLTSYWYWFVLSTLWVSYTGHSDLALWKELFSSPRKNRETSLMKPDELAALRRLPDVVTLYRAHRPGEQDWIAYTLDPQIAARFAHERGVSKIALYEVNKADILALFLRRGEKEVLVLDKNAVRPVRTIPVLSEAPRLLAAWKFSQIVPADGEHRFLIHTDDALKISRLIRVAPEILVDEETPLSALPPHCQVSYLVAGGNANTLCYPLSAPDEVRDAVFAQIVNLLLRDADATTELVRREARLKGHLDTMDQKPVLYREGAVR